MFQHLEVYHSGILSDLNLQYGDDPHYPEQGEQCGDPEEGQGEGPGVPEGFRLQVLPQGFCQHGYRGIDPEEHQEVREQDLSYKVLRGRQD